MKSLAQRKLSKELGVTLIHVDDGCGPGWPDGLDVPVELMGCCMGAAARGPEHCTCWEPIYDVEQSGDLDVGGEQTTRAECCHDCAYRNGSPERADGYTDELVDVAGDLRGRFACHQGMRRVVGWRHPALGDVTLEAGPGDYRPPRDGARCFRADGTVADLCAGWAAHRRYLLGDERD